jgi:hypothetical protein
MTFSQLAIDDCPLAGPIVTIWNATPPATTAPCCLSLVQVEGIPLVATRPIAPAAAHEREDQVDGWVHL